MKPGKKDIAIQCKISGRQLEELQKHTWQMCEAFGLDTKIDNYKGVRPISFYSWDLECLLDVLDMTLNDAKSIRINKMRVIYSCTSCMQA